MSSKDKNKLYALHAPEVEYISKRKARTPCEFGLKVRQHATTLKEGLVVGMRHVGQPLRRLTLAETLEQVVILTGMGRPSPAAIVDKGYRGEH